MYSVALLPLRMLVSGQVANSHAILLKTSADVGLILLACIKSSSACVYFRCFANADPRFSQAISSVGVSLMPSVKSLIA